MLREFTQSKMKMIRITLLVIAYIAFLGCKCEAQEHSWAIDASTQNLQENPCLQRGGVCALASSCPAESQIDQKGLCPHQQSRGVECCTVPSKIPFRECGQRGGGCSPVESCGRAPRELYAICPAGEVCCIYL